MNKKNNARALQTKKQFENALLVLLKEGVRMEEISVSSLCKKAGFHRSTFYSHYEIPLDVLKGIQDRFLQKTEMHLKKVNGRTGEKTEDFLHFLKENAEAYSMLLQSRLGREFAQKLIQIALDRFGFFNGYIANSDLAPYLDAFIFQGGSQVLLLWMEKGFNLPEETLGSFIAKATQSILSPFCRKKKVSE